MGMMRGTKLSSRWRRASLVCLVGWPTLAGCDRQATPSSRVSTPAPRDAQTGTRTGAAADRRGIESVVESLFAALSHKNYASACNDYTANIQSAVILAAKKISGRDFPTCARALGAIMTASPAVSSVRLGRPRFSALSISGDVASLRYSSKLSNGLVAHSDVVAIFELGNWKVDRATSLTFSGSR